MVVVVVVVVVTVVVEALRLVSTLVAIPFMASGGGEGDVPLVVGEEGEVGEGGSWCEFECGGESSSSVETNHTYRGLVDNHTE